MDEVLEEGGVAWVMLNLIWDLYWSMDMIPVIGIYYTKLRYLYHLRDRKSVV